MSQFLRLLFARGSKSFQGKKMEVFYSFLCARGGTPVLLKMGVVMRQQRERDEQRLARNWGGASRNLHREPPLICALCMCVRNYTPAALGPRDVGWKWRVPGRTICLAAGVHQQKPNFSRTHTKLQFQARRCNLCPLAVSLARWFRQQFYREVLVCKSGCVP
jgi:hypothetical protein